MSYKAKPIAKPILLLLIALLMTACSTTSQFYDSALNDKNRAPASMALPKIFDEASAETVKIDPLHNQSAADFFFMQAEMESHAGRSKQSIELLSEALVYDRGSATIMQRLSVENYKIGQLHEAVEWAERAWLLAPDRRDLGMLYAGLCTATKNYNQAEELYTELIKRDAEDGDAMMYLGAVYTEQKKYQLARRTLTRLARVKEHTSQHLTHYYLARIEAEEKPSAHRRVMAELRQALKIKPDFFEAATMLGHLIEKTQGAEKAFSFYADFQKKGGPHPKVAEMLSQYYITKAEYDLAYEQLEILEDNSEDQLQVKLKMALILIDKKIYEPAVDKLKDILSQVPDSDKVRYYLGAVYQEMKQSASAIAEYRQIAKSSQFYEEAWLRAAFLAKSEKNYSLAQEILNEFLANSAAEVGVQAYFLLSQLQEEQKKNEQALKTLIDVGERFANSAEYHYYLGSLQDRLNLKSEMLVSMQKVVELEPEHAQALNYLAYTWAESGENLEQAEEYARRAVFGEKDDAYILDTLGWVLYKQERYSEAVIVLERAHKMLPSASIIAEHLGDVYMRTSAHNKARLFFIKAAESESDAERKSEIMMKLSNLEDKIKNLRSPSSNGVGLNKDVSP